MSLRSCKVFEVDSVVNLHDLKLLLHFLMKMSTIPSISLKYIIISDGVELYGTIKTSKSPFCIIVGVSYPGFRKFNESGKEIANIV